jgi:hypothetical protein
MDISGIPSNPYRQYIASNQAKKEPAIEESSDDSKIDKAKDFARGVLGLDAAENDTQEVTSADNTSTETDVDVDEEGSVYHQLGQYVKAAGTVGSVICFFI